MTVPHPALQTEQLFVFFLEVAVLLSLAVGLGRVATWLRLPSVVGELMAGVLVGPSLLGHFFPSVAEWMFPHRGDQIYLLDAVGQLGLVLLAGVTGAQLDFGLVRRRGSAAVRISLGGLLVPLALGVLAGMMIPDALVPDGVSRRVFALFIGVAMCISALPVIAKTLADMKLLHRDVGQLTLAAAIVDDAVGWLLLSLVTALATVGLSIGAVSEALLRLVLFVVVAMVVGRLLIKIALRSTGAEPGPNVAVTVVIILLGASAAAAISLEPVFGAFIAGSLMGSRGVVAPGLIPLRMVVLTFFAPLFLSQAGLRMDVTRLSDPVVLSAAVGLVFVAVVGKFLGAYLGARLSRMTNWEALALGAGLNARGVVEVVIAAVGLRLGILEVEAYTILVLIALVTSLAAPPLLRVAMAHVENTSEEDLRQVRLDIR